MSFSVSERIEPELAVDRTLTRTTHLCVQLITARTAQIFHSCNTRGSSRLPWCVKSGLSSQRHVSHVAALVTEHFYTISLTNITCFPTILPRCPVPSRPILDWILKPCETHGRLADTQICISHRLRAQDDPIRSWTEILGQIYSLEELNLTGILGQIRIEYQKEFLGDHYQKPFTEDTDEFGQVGVENSYVQSQIHSDYDSAESTEDSDLEDGELRKMLPHRCICKVEKTVNHLEKLQHQGNLKQ